MVLEVTESSPPDATKIATRNEDRRQLALKFAKLLGSMMGDAMYSRTLKFETAGDEE